MNKEKAVPKQFSELRLIPGDAFSIESLANGNRYPVRMIGYVDNESLMVSAPKLRGKLIQLSEGQLFKVRLIAGKFACGFQTKVINSRRLPYLYSHLTYPTKFDAVAIRQSNRVKLNIETVISEAEPGSLHGDWPQRAQIIDLSSGGARLQSFIPLAATGSRLILSFDTVVDGVSRQQQLPAIVRSISEVDDGFQYGLQFTEVSDEQRVYISGSIYERLLGFGNQAASVPVA